jgi:hypothetical protein
MMAALETEQVHSLASGKRKEGSERQREDLEEQDATAQVLEQAPSSEAGSVLHLVPAAQAESLAPNEDGAFCMLLVRTSGGGLAWQACQLVCFGHGIQYRRRRYIRDEAHVHLVNDVQLRSMLGCVLCWPEGRGLVGSRRRGLRQGGPHTLRCLHPC